MAAYEIMCFLAREGVPNATRQRLGGELLITAIRSGKQYTDLQECLDQEFKSKETQDEQQ